MCVFVFVLYSFRFKNESSPPSRHVPGGPENLRRAWFGVPSGAWRDAEHVGAECSEAVRRLMETKRPIITSPGTLGCDPVPGVWIIA